MIKSWQIVSFIHCSGSRTRRFDGGSAEDSSATQRSNPNMNMITITTISTKLEQSAKCQSSRDSKRYVMQLLYKTQALAMSQARLVGSVEHQKMWCYSR